jgi:hypothetical protein
MLRCYEYLVLNIMLLKLDNCLGFRILRLEFLSNVFSVEVRGFHIYCQANWFTVLLSIDTL